MATGGAKCGRPSGPGVCEQAVLAAGPWTKALAAELGIELRSR